MTENWDAITKMCVTLIGIIDAPIACKHNFGHVHETVSGRD